MSWDRPTMSAALAEVLGAGTAGTVTVFPAPPATFNPPALVVQYPTTVTKHSPAFGVDLAALPVLAAVGAPEGGALDALLEQATAAVEADISLAGTVQSAKTVEWRNWRILTVAGVDMLVAELVLEIRM